jgi:hypothetical protein
VVVLCSRLLYHPFLYIYLYLFILAYGAVRYQQPACVAPVLLQPRDALPYARPRPYRGTADRPFSIALHVHVHVEVAVAVAVAVKYSKPCNQIACQPYRNVI